MFLSRKMALRISKALSGRRPQLLLVGPSFSSPSSSFSSSAPPEHQQQQHDKNRRISRTLYRQLLRWCQSKHNDGYPDAILEFMGIPPMQFAAPDDIDPYRMELLYEASHNVKRTENHDSLDTPDDQFNDNQVVHRALQLLPPKCDLTRKLLVAPLNAVSELRGLVRAVFRLNGVTRVPDDDLVAHEALQSYEKNRRTTAFQALKSLNELGLERLERHVDRTGVEFMVGQVVQHRDERWRGVILAWESNENSTTPSSSNRTGSMRTEELSQDFSKLTTLTTKDYNDSKSSVNYTVLLDAGDAYMMGAELTRRVRQSELDVVRDPQLSRVRSHWTQQHFVGYDPATRRFAPNARQLYEYPNDGLKEKKEAPPEKNASKAETIASKAEDLYTQVGLLCEEISVGVQEIAAQLNTLLVDAALENDTTADYDLFGETQRGLHEIVKGNVLPSHYRFRSRVPPPTLTAFHIKALLDLSQSILETMFQRRNAIKTRVEFAVGDIVRHKKYGFRGVVMAWDPEPAMDVSRWDGLQDIANPMAQPFYHVLPDQADCREAFGGERPMRYVCEENLEVVRKEEEIATMEVGVDPKWHLAVERKRYEAPALVRFRHGEDLGDDGAFERCMERLEDAINRWQYQARQDSIEDSTLQKLSLANLHKLLKAVDNVVDAGIVEDLVKEMRKAHPHLEVRSRLEKGVAAMVAGNAEEACDIFESVVDTDPGYAEGWNKLGTCEFMLGKHTKAKESSLKALRIDPLHFQARNGLGLILFEKQDFQQAADCFRQSLELDPWSPVSSKLSVCLDLLSQMVHKDEVPF